VQEAVLEVGVDQRFFNRRLQRMVGQAAQHGVDHRGKDETLHARLDRRRDHRLSELRLVGKKCRCDVKHGRHAVECARYACAIGQIADRDLRDARAAHLCRRLGFANQSSDFGTPRGQGRNDQSGKFAVCPDCQYDFIHGSFPFDRLSA
jgi:hypothetical protein